jgi:tellurite resistance protein
MLKTDVKKLKMLTMSTSEAKFLTFDPEEIQTWFQRTKVYLDDLQSIGV